MSTSLTVVISVSAEGSRVGYLAESETAELSVFALCIDFSDSQSGALNIRALTTVCLVSMDRSISIPTSRGGTAERSVTSWLDISMV